MGARAVVEGGGVQLVSYPEGRQLVLSVVAQLNYAGAYRSLSRRIVRQVFNQFPEVGRKGKVLRLGRLLLPVDPSASHFGPRPLHFEFVSTSLDMVSLFPSQVDVAKSGRYCVW